MRRMKLKDSYMSRVSRIVSQAHTTRPLCTNSWQGLSTYERRQIFAQRGLSGSGLIIIATMQVHRQIGEGNCQIYLQEAASLQSASKLEGSKIVWNGDSYKLRDGGTSNRRNGLATAVSEIFRDKISVVKRASYRVMAIKVQGNSKTTNEIKCHFHRDALEIKWINSKISCDDFLSTVHEHKSAVLGKLKQTCLLKCEGADNCQGNHGSEISNEEEKRILEFTLAHNLAMTNTYFEKRYGYLITFASASARSQVDFK